MIRPPPKSTLFPYTPLSRSRSTPQRRARAGRRGGGRDALPPVAGRRSGRHPRRLGLRTLRLVRGGDLHLLRRSEEHTSELQSPCNLVCRLLLEKKKKTERLT